MSSTDAPNAPTTDPASTESSAPLASAKSTTPIGLGRPPRAGAQLPSNPTKLSRFVANTRKVVSGPSPTAGAMAAMTGIYLGDLHWWTTDAHLVALCAKLGAPIELKNVSFSEHKVNGKSKGVAYVEFETEEHAALVKNFFDANDFQHHKMNAQLSAGSGGQNPFKTLPKEPYLRSTSANTPAQGNFKSDASSARPLRNASGATTSSGGMGDMSTPASPNIPSGPSSAQPGGGVGNFVGSQQHPNGRGFGPVPSQAQGHAAAQTASLIQQQQTQQQLIAQQQQQHAFAQQQNQAAAGMGWAGPGGAPPAGQVPYGVPGMIPPGMEFAAGGEPAYWAGAGHGQGQMQNGMMMIH